MNATAEAFKLLELRNKTDRQLAEFIGSRLDAGIRWASAGLFEEARHACTEAETLLPCVRKLGSVERKAIARKIEDLKQRLDSFAACSELNVRQAC